MTAYDKRINDWSSDVCSSDLHQSGSCGRGTCYDIRNNWPSGWIAIGICNHREDKGSEQEIYHGAGCDDNCALPTRKRFQCDLALFGAFRIVIGEFDVSADKDGRQSPFCAAFIGPARDLAAKRSEEHTSELQSLMRISYAVFCLKKKKQYNTLEKNDT